MSPDQPAFIVSEERSIDSVLEQMKAGKEVPQDGRTWIVVELVDNRFTWYAHNLPMDEVYKYFHLCADDARDEMIKQTEDGNAQ